jgi:hypothetical protein
MRNISDKICRGNENKYVFCVQKHFPQNRAVCEMMWKIMVELDMPQMTV